MSHPASAPPTRRPQDWSHADQLGQILNMTKAELLAAAGIAQHVAQTGAWYLGGTFELPTWDALADTTVDEALIETFVAAEPGTVSATGMTPELAKLFAEPATRLHNEIASALVELGVTVIGNAYITASITPTSMVSGDPHLDDDQYQPDDGVGIVAIVGSRAGPTVACTPQPHRPSRPGLPLELADHCIADFGADPGAVQTASANRIAVFPQFGQLHAGPGPDAGANVEPCRSLLVYRAATAPSAGC